jgi:hypothetical protein
MIPIKFHINKILDADMKLSLCLSKKILISIDDFEKIIKEKNFYIENVINNSKKIDITKILIVVYKELYSTKIVSKTLNNYEISLLITRIIIMSFVNKTQSNNDNEYYIYRNDIIKYCYDEISKIFIVIDIIEEKKICDIILKKLKNKIFKIIEILTFKKIILEKRYGSDTRNKNNNDGDIYNDSDDIYNDSDDIYNTS